VTVTRIGKKIKGHPDRCELCNFQDKFVRPCTEPYICTAHEHSKKSLDGCWTVTREQRRFIAEFGCASYKPIDPDYNPNKVVP
jgi:hypothetical protein